MCRFQWWRSVTFTGFSNDLSASLISCHCQWSCISVTDDVVMVCHYFCLVCSQTSCISLTDDVSVPVVMVCHYFCLVCSQTASVAFKHGGRSQQAVANIAAKWLHPWWCSLRPHPAAHGQGQTGTANPNQKPLHIHGNLSIISLSICHVCLFCLSLFLPQPLSVSLSLSLYLSRSLWMMYGMCSSGAVSTLCFVWTFWCIMFHSIIHAYMYIINNACNLISVHQQLSKD